MEVISPPTEGSALTLSEANTGSAAHDILGKSVAGIAAGGQNPRGQFRWLRVVFTPEIGGITAETVMSAKSIGTRDCNMSLL